MSDFETEFVRRNELSHALAMVHCLQDHFLEMRETAEKSLIRHLPKMLPEDRDWVDEMEIRAMVDALHPDRPQLTIALLEALGYVGNEKVLRRVESLSSQIAANSSPLALSMRTAASLCMDRLRSYSIQTKQARTLLRGSEEPPTPIDRILLRAAAETSTSISNELLRPGPLAPDKEALKGIQR